MIQNRASLFNSDADYRRSSYTTARDCMSVDGLNKHDAVQLQEQHEEQSSIQLSPSHCAALRNIGSPMTIRNFNFPTCLCSTRTRETPSYYCPRRGVRFERLNVGGQSLLTKATAPGCYKYCEGVFRPGQSME